MPIGSLDEQIYFQSSVSANDGGSLKTSWLYADVIDDDQAQKIKDWAHVISQKGGVAFAAARNESKSLIRVQVHYRDDVKTDWRIEWDGQFYNIIELDRTQRRDGWLWFTAEKTAAE